MKIAVAIPNHNQHWMVAETIRKLYSLPTKPAAVYVLSDAKPYWASPEDPGKVIEINNRDKFLGRCGNRNSAVQPFLDSDYDAIVFMDGDCYPDSEDFLGAYEKLFRKHELVFGTRRHDKADGLSVPPSDLLTANMDNLWLKRPVDYTDLRVVAGAVKEWQGTRSFSERLDLMLTGMIGWSCNFGFTREGLRKLRKFQESTYSLHEGIFDSDAFGDGWGYEDVAMGIDALYAGLDIWITDTVRVGHRSHDRSDGLFDHVKGRHKIMERCRMLDWYVKSKTNVMTAMLLLYLFFIAGVITGLVTMNFSMSNFFDLGY